MRGDKERERAYEPWLARHRTLLERTIMKPQWWMEMKGGLAEAAIDVVKDKKIMIRPEKSEMEYFRWMENINDWCVSRQLWWGHQPPAYFVNIEGEPVNDGDGDGDGDGERWVTGSSRGKGKG